MLAAFDFGAEGGGPTLKHAALLEVEQKQHSEGLFLGIEEALRACGWDWKDLAGIGVGIGPGSFTGIRVGLTAARTFGQMLGLPLFPVSSLALSARASGCEVVLREACMGEIYVRHGSGPRTQEVVLKISEFDAWLQGIGSAGSVAAFAEARVWAHPGVQVVASSRGWNCLDEKGLAADANRWGLALAEECSGVISGGPGLNALEVLPVYLRAPDAELKLRAKLTNLG